MTDEPNVRSLIVKLAYKTIDYDARQIAKEITLIRGVESVSRGDIDNTVDTDELLLDGIKLVRIDHDNLENDDPIRVSELGIFIGWGEVTDQDKISALFDEMDSVNIYLGYDGNVYPQFRLEKVKLL